MPVSNEHFQAIKITLGQPGWNDGPVCEGNPLPVKVLEMPQSGGGLTDVELRATPVPVSGTFYPATQTVNGSVSVSGSVAVTGTFWQATQPVSGTFWQATQPVSIASMPSTPVTGTFWQATQPVSLATLPKAREDAVAMTWASVKSAAPAANAVQATTGALVAGDYDFDITLACSDTIAVGKGLVIEHRNSTDNATLQNLGACTPNGGAVLLKFRRYTIATNERIRVIAGTAAGAASSMYISAIGRRVS